MTGYVDDADRAIVELNLQSSADGEVRCIAAWIDTAFTGDLVIPTAAIGLLGLLKSAAVAARLADGTEVILETFSCLLDWFGERRAVEVIANDGQMPLLGIGLLKSRKLEIDYRSRSIVID